jgi:zinc transport system substrate-binding protein
VYVVNYPLKYFAERIGGDLVDVQFPVPAGEDPAYWSPGSAAIVAYQQADVILLNGAGYANWVDKVSLPPSKLVDTSSAFADRLIEIKGQTTHIHGPKGKHAHGGYAFTTWLDPKLAMEQARAVNKALCAKLPDSKVELANRFAELEGELLEIDKQLKDVFSAAPKRPLVFSHPVYQYFARRYGLNSKSVHWEPDETPTEAMWAELKELLAGHPARWMIWEGEPTAETVAGLKKLGVGGVVFDPCGNAPASGDFLSAMRSNLANLQVINGERGS